MLVILFPTLVSAHTSLLEANPAPNSELVKAPETVTLTFSGTLDSSLYEIKLYQDEGKEVVFDEATKIEDNQQTIYRELTDLDSGDYSLSYKVIGADGHVIEDTYSFSLRVDEQAALKEEDSEASEIVNESVPEKENKDNKNEAISKEKEREEKLNNESELDEATENHIDVPAYLIRALYYFSLLTISGLVFWSFFTNISKSSTEKVYRKSSMYLKVMLLISVVISGYLQSNSLLTDMTSITTLLVETTIGRAWMSLIGLSILSFFILHRSTFIDAIWIVLLLFTEAISGHANAMKPVILNISLDIIHLGAAAIWISGIVILLLFWKSNEVFIKSFIPIFSTYALISMITLAISGSVMTVFFLPDITLLWSSLWGQVLLLKIVVFIIIALIGYFMRKAYKKTNQKAQQHLLKGDILLILVILLVVSVLTHVSPLP
ncbi:copper transport protein [Saliterribacillus persicus]|uniref:Copper transport protein n=2 Tax=Saliterribacillus persicus TaxID=930114 RepID=A0A368XZF5_9BACI|nr:copper transport protein [Saliterribacillus persicus]